MPKYSEAEARAAIAESQSYSEALRKLGLRVAGGNHKLFRKWVDEVWQIPTHHFEDQAQRIARLHGRRPARPLNEILVEHSTYPRDKVKRRLYAEGLKRPECELCGQGELWRGRRMAMIIDHINGVPDDHRLENLRIVCPNCAATLDTHCGRKNRSLPTERECLGCGEPFMAITPSTAFCSQICVGKMHHDERLGIAKPEFRRVERPPFAQLLAEIKATNYSAVGRKYGVSDNAIRKWVRQYRREAAVGKIEDVEDAA